MGHDGSHFSSVLDSSAQGSAALNSSGTSKNLANGSIIRIQKPKYQGLIKQRGAQITVHSPNLIGHESVSDMNNGGSRIVDRNDGFSSPHRQAQI